MNLKTHGRLPLGGPFQDLSERRVTEDSSTPRKTKPEDHPRTSEVPHEENCNEHLRQAPAGPSTIDPATLPSSTSCPVRGTLRFVLDAIKRTGRNRP